MGWGVSYTLATNASKSTVCTGTEGGRSPLNSVTEWRGWSSEHSPDSIRMGAKEAVQRGSAKKAQEE